MCVYLCDAVCVWNVNFQFKGDSLNWKKFGWPREENGTFFGDLYYFFEIIIILMINTRKPIYVWKFLRKCMKH